MKKIMLSVAAIAFLFGATLLTSCTTDDTSKPVITLKGNANTTVVLNGTYTDEGATADDDKDGDLTSSITSNVSATNPNVNLKGSYTITYTVTDAAGNTGTKDRTVVVANSAENQAGSYNASDDWNSDGTSDYSWVETVTSSSSINNQLVFSKFAYYTGCALKINVTGTTIAYPGTQTFNCGAGTAQQDRTFSQIAGAISGTTMTVNYHEVDADGFTTDGVDTFVKQ